MTTTPPTYPARSRHEQLVHYFRKTVNFDDGLIATPTTAGPFGRLPANAQILAVQVEIVTAFNAVTTNVLTVGTSTTANEIVAAGDVDETAVGVTDVLRGRGTALTAAAEVNLYAKYTQSGTAATAGKANIVITYATNNDK